MKCRFDSCDPRCSWTTSRSSCSYRRWQWAGTTGGAVPPTWGGRAAGTGSTPWHPSRWRRHPLVISLLNISSMTLASRVLSGQQVNLTEAQHKTTSASTTWNNTSQLTVSLNLMCHLQFAKSFEFLENTEYTYNNAYNLITFLWYSKKQMSTAPCIPRQSPIKELTWLNVA